MMSAPGVTSSRASTARTTAAAVLLAVDALSDGTPGADIMRGTTLAPDFAEIGLECGCLPEDGSVGDRVAGSSRRTT